MFIKSLHLTNFKRFKELDLEFPGDITVIKGPNEQGKSTIAQALIAGLFYDPGKSNEMIKSLCRWGCEKFYTIRLSFEADGEDYTLEKDFEKKKILLKNETTGESTDDYKEVTKKLGQVGGYQTQEVFFNTSCVKQGEMTVLDRKETITEALQDIISGGGVSISLNSIFKRIEEAREELRRGLERGLVKNPGIMLRQKTELDARVRELEEKKRIFEEEDVSREILGKLRAEKEILQKKFDVKEQLGKSNREYFEVRKVLEGLNAEYDRLRKHLDALRNLEKERSALKKQADTLRAFSDIDTKSFLILSHEIEGFDEKIGDLESQMKIMAKKGIRAREMVNRPYLFMGIALLAVGALGFFVDPIFFLSWAMFGLFSFWVAFSKSVISLVSGKKLQKESRGLARQKEKKLKELKNKFSSLNVQSLEELEQKKEDLRVIAGKIQAQDAKIDGMLSDTTFDQLLESKEALEKRLAIEESKIDKARMLQAPSHEEQVGLERDMESLRKEIARLDKEIIGTEAMLSRAKAPMEDIVRLEERTSFLVDELRRAERKDKVFAILSEALREARQSTFSSTRKVLEQYIGEFFSEITEGKYNAILLGEGLKIKVFSSEKGEEIEPEGAISKGALEQLYLVARFALISLLYSGVARPLVILDDPFGNFDARRRAKTRNILARLSKKFQILLLTCSNDYDTWGKVVDLTSR